jgi:hypothetical protein
MFYLINNLMYDEFAEKTGVSNGVDALNVKQHCCSTGKFRSIRRGGRRRFFRAFALASAKLKKSAKKKCEKAKAPSAIENKREFALYLPPTVEIRF